MIRKWLLPSLFLVASLACAVLVPSHQDSERPLSTVFDSLVCDPPCWQNLTPGQSTYDEAYDTLKRLAVFDKQIEVVRRGDGDLIVFYHYPANSDRPFDDVKEEVLFWINKSGVLVEIEFREPSRDDPRMPLSYVLARLGEPDYAIQHMYGEIGPMTILHYPERGIEIWCIPVPGKCHSDDGDVRVFFYPPNSYESRLVARYGSLEKARYAQQFFCPWVGVEAEYFLVNWGSFPSGPTTPPRERCPSR